MVVHDNGASFLAVSTNSFLQTRSVSAWSTDFYHLTLVPLSTLTLLLAWFTRPKSSEEVIPAGFWAHQWRYIVVWAPAIAADWFQGPYVYALYASYGYSTEKIAQLFVAGFGASMLFGTFVGSLADAFGRKRCAILYCVLYAASCCTKHSSDFGLLMLGRVTGGIATSLLFSTFECWMVAEHNQRLGYNQSLLKYMFGVMYFVQYLAAIVAGVVAQAAADALPLTRVEGFGNLYYGGYTAPFDLSLVFLLGTIPLICFLWEENFGDDQCAGGFVESLCAAGRAVRASWRVALLGVIVACFEGSMFAFVFNWTPALDSKAVPPPYGIIFSAFMMACMCGSSLFSLIVAPPAWILFPVFALGATALALVTNFAGTLHLGVVFAGFLIFEFCCGIYFPAMGDLKSGIVPEEARAGVYNMYRVPLNAVVVGLLLTHLSMKTAFGLCCTLLMMSAVAVVPFLRPTRQHSEHKVT